MTNKKDRYKNIRIERTGTRKSIVRDRGRYASEPGKRISRFGKMYWETRKNRSDLSNSRF